MIHIPHNTSKAGEYNLIDLCWQIRHFLVLNGPTIVMIGYQLISSGTIDATAGWGIPLGVALDALDKWLKNHEKK